ncbi:MAG TPA: CusA/CzcA family heavy metal efflux RND transporter [Cyclobacteriaceae bacterium]|jgi:cobalt-zinc-cadmium resistance protein CzcA
MFEKIIHFSVHNKFIVALLVLAIIGGGFYAFENIPVDAVPDITNNQVQVVTVSPTLSAEEVERLITYPVEVSMANLPGVVELRSISRYGLSVVTIVFEDDVSITDARQFVSEQIAVAEEDIPPGLGKPELMPITTGLGEIYQYVLEVDEGYEDRYDVMELRTIQDWIVKRQLAGIPGVVEVSSFGGFVKQYQVSADPGTLRAFDLTMQDIIRAVQTNNQSTGGSYLQRGANAFYIRTDGVLKSTRDIENVVVDNRNGTPVLLKQVASIREAYPPRYGAMTRNGKGEAVGGITLMLRNANSSSTLKNIHQRVADIQSSLPEGVRIKPYLDRSELVGRTTGTIKTNLIEGGLIVILVLVLLLGNLRAGLIVASVIPLSLMFAFVMMYVFGVSANLMSLGAIDFGIVVDGAVIIVEGILHALLAYHVGKTLSREEMDGVVAKSASSIYRTAAFGVLIIIVVFIPIMTLTGIEGKMFRPMAQTVSFAVLGALVLSLTYVPMMSSLVLKRSIIPKPTLSDRIMAGLQRAYRIVLDKALAHPAGTVSITLGLFIGSIWIFTRLGGVFIPQLEEGDLAMQMTLPAGSSLDESIRNSTLAEQILLDQFPEVKQVVSKIGTAEVPTDPMSVEQADIMIVLKDKSEWTSAETREELIAKMESALSVIIGPSFDFTQPIQLRFNELMTGAKTDVAIKLFGDDMDLMHDRVVEAASLISHVPGVADIQVEQTEGLPQWLIQFNREKIAQHGIAVEDVNTVIRAAFAGEPVGVVFEGERKFDLVVRLDAAQRAAFDLSRLTVRNAAGQSVPVSELAYVKETVGPAQISRDNARRRITLGINVRNRDVESLVNEVRATLNEKLSLPPGYYFEYGGDFENLQQAKKRLQVAVPIALALIVVLLYFAFGSFKYALLIFLAVPLSSIGGILALWMRGLPFSISAGVGFIALFGVAVLNGIVLISYFNELKSSGKMDLTDVVIKGGMVRLRPVIMTATVAALGFMPMALSQSAGAEVQRPLATVVIGGLVSATLLTLVVLPVLYRALETYALKRMKLRTATLVTTSMLTLMFVPVQGQDTLRLGEQQAIELALSRHPQVEIARLEVESRQRQQKGAFEIPATEVGLQYGQINSPARDAFWEVSQNLGSIPAHLQRAKLGKQNVELAREQQRLTEKDITYQVRLAWQRWLYLRQVTRELHQQLAFYEDFESRTRIQYEAGESSLLEKTLAESHLHELRNELVLRTEELRQAATDLQHLLFVDQPLTPDADTLIALAAPQMEVNAQHPFVSVLEEEAEVRAREAAVSKAALFPQVRVGYFRQDITDPDRRFTGLEGWNVGVAIPLWFFPSQAAVQRGIIETRKANEALALGKRQLENNTANAHSELEKYSHLLDYYRTTGLSQAALLQQTARLQLEAGEIDPFQYLQSAHQARQIRIRYLESVLNYNRTVIRIDYLTE